MKEKITYLSRYLTWALVAVLVVASGAEGYQIWRLQGENTLVKDSNTSLEEQLAEAREENRILLERVDEQDNTIRKFSATIEGITDTVDTLEKLSKTDEELLQKYSKVYFLNENYSPTDLSYIDEDYLYNKNRQFQIHADVWPYLRRLIRDAERDEVELLVASAFRSFGEQASLKAGYTFLYGSGANRFSADQGYSEHQLGTTVDFTTTKVGAVFDNFKNDPAYKWLLENAHKYGFVLSYPEGNAYYKYEPWHWRFVGEALAEYLHEEGKHFYDLDQREIDEYLVKIFD